MSLATYIPETVTILVPVKKGADPVTFTVRGLNTDDLTWLVTEHLHDVEATIELWSAAREEIMARGSMDAFILKMVGSVPGLVSEVISVVAGERHLKDVYRTLPFSVSALALTHILRLTMEENGGLKNLSTALVKLVNEMLPENARAALGSWVASRGLNLNGSTGESEEK